jgi:YD repeat-containing protein
LAEYEYDELSRRTLLALGNDVNAIYEYDLGNRLTKLTNNLDDTNSIVFDYASYDKVGNRLSMKIDDANSHVYTYDVVYRLTFVDYNDGNTTSYSFDSLGNRIDVNESGSTTGYSRNSLNQYTSVGGTGYSYDDNGNLTNDGTYLYYYDCENRLTDVNDKSTGDPVASYSYDYQGRRISKTVSGVTTKYCYNGARVIAEYDGSRHDNTQKVQS